MIEVYDQTRSRVAVLQNAYGVTEKRRINSVWELSFSLPANDPKAAFCVPRNFVRWNDGELYRILDYDVEQDGKKDLVFACEHVIATLIDHLLFRDHERVGYTTRQNIEYILSFQDDWILGDCDFSLSYDYAWTSENLLAALWSIATPFTSYYQYTFDTASYPWTVNLKRINPNQSSQFFIWAGFNFLRGKKTTYSSEVITRLYCLGYGEGVNQLTIAGVNNGLPYIQDDAAIAEYGLIEAVFVDRKYEDAQSLLAAGQAILQASSSPRIEYELEIADLYKITKNDYHKAELGRIVKFVDDDYKTFITEIEWDYDNDGMKIAVANKPEDLASAIADLADRQRIESTYAQGATQVWAAPLATNATASQPLVYDLWIPTNLRIMNEVKLKVKLERFRAFSKTSGSNAQTSSTSGQSSLTTTEANQEFASTIPQDTSEAIDWGDGAGHFHTVNRIVPSHTHGMAHTHQVTIPSHTHDITPGIYRVGANPDGARVVIGQQEYTFSGASDERDITAMLIGQDGKIPRGSFIEIKIYPTGTSQQQQVVDDGWSNPATQQTVQAEAMAYVTASVAAVGFIQSKTGGNY